MKKLFVVSAIIVALYALLISFVRIPDMQYSGSATSGSQLPVGEQIDVTVVRSFRSWLLVRGIDIMYVHILVVSCVALMNVSWFLYHGRNGLRATATRVRKYNNRRMKKA